MLATIRDKGKYPCPRCLIPLARVQNMGTKRDMQQRQELRRTDNDKRKEKVTKARAKIYEKNMAVNNDGVDAILVDESLVPTIVSHAPINRV